MSAITPLPGSPIAPAPMEPGATILPAPRATSPPERPTTAATPAAKPADPESVRRAISDLQKMIDQYAREPRDATFRYDEEHHVFVIEIRERESGELLLSYPSEKILKVRDTLDELLGAIIDRKI
jgi:uncharacterized FlaG/YvyC family protein